MGEENYISGNSQQDGSSQNNLHKSSTIINTKGCCFMCLKTVNSPSHYQHQQKMMVNKTHNLVSLNVLRRCLQLQFNSKSSPNFKEERNQNIQVELCNSCKMLINSFSESFSTLEILQMEVNYWLGRIHGEISEAINNPELVQNYSWRMTSSDSDALALEELLFVENLRKEIESKSLRIRAGLQLRVNLERLSILEESNQITEICLPLIISKVEAPEPEQTEELLEEDWPESLSPPPLLSPHPLPDFFLSSSAYQLKVSNNSPPETILQDLQPPEAEVASAAPSLPSTFNHFTQPQQQQQEEVTINTAPAPRGSMYVFNKKTRMYNCKACEMKFSVRSVAWSHFQVVHLNRKSYHKNKSSQKNQTKRGSMYKFNPETKKYNCNICPMGFSSRSMAWSHFHSVHKNLKCDICKIVMKQEDLAEFHRHRAICKARLQQSCHFDNGDGGDSGLNCLVCGKTFLSRNILKEHHRLVHLNERKYECDICKKRFKLRAHLKDHHATIHLRKKFICRICNKRVQTQYKLRRHEMDCKIKNKIDGQYYPSMIKPPGNSKIQKFKVSCPTCGKWFTTSSRMEKHRLFVHLKLKDEEFRCEICNTDFFTNRQAFGKHKSNCQKKLDRKQERENDPKYKSRCDVCQKKFLNLTSTLQHQRLVHWNERNHECNLCGKTFQMAGHLTDHKNAKHFGIKFRCQFCNKKVQSETKLRKHEGECTKSKL